MKFKNILLVALLVTTITASECFCYITESTCAADSACGWTSSTHVCEKNTPTLDTCNA